MKEYRIVRVDEKQCKRIERWIRSRWPNPIKITFQSAVADLIDAGLSRSDSKGGANV